MYMYATNFYRYSSLLLLNIGPGSLILTRKLGVDPVRMGLT